MGLLPYELRDFYLCFAAVHNLRSRCLGLLPIPLKVVYLLNSIKRLLNGPAGILKFLSTDLPCYIDQFTHLLEGRSNVCKLVTD